MTLSQSQRLRNKAEKDKRRKLVVADKRKAEIADAIQGEARQMLEAARAPIRICLMSPRIFETGMGNVTLARTLPSGQIAASHFLLDVWCLGVKSAYFRVTDRQTFDHHVESMNQSEVRVPAEPSVARKLVFDAVAYARSIGFEPSPDFDVAARIFGDIPPAADEFVFGKDGKPFYLPAPEILPLARASLSPR